MKIDFFTFLFTNLDRELSKGRDGGKAEPSLPRSERRLLQIVVRRDHVFQVLYVNCENGLASRNEVLESVVTSTIL